MPRTDLITLRAPEPPGLLARVQEAIRSRWSGPLTSNSPELARYFGAGPVAAGVSVTEASAQTNAAVVACIDRISNDVASLPLLVYARRPDDGRERATRHPVYRLLHDEPNPEQTPMVFRRTLQAHVLLWGNGYAEIERDVMGRPIALWPMVPDRVQPFRTPAGDLAYRVSNPNGGTVDVPAADMFHLVGRSHDGSVGASLVTYARESIGLSLAAEQFGATFYKNGGTLSGVVSNKGPKPTQQAAQGQRDADEARHAGIKQAHKWLQLWNDATFTPITVPPDNAQFLETRQFQLEEICRWFSMPPHKIQHLLRATYSNIEQQSTDYLISCLRPWLVLWEQECARKLLRPTERERFYIEHITQALLTADAAGRAALYRELFAIGALTPNEARRLENLNPIPGGDQAYVSSGMTPIARPQQ